MTAHPYRLGFAVKVLGDGGLRAYDSRRWQSGPSLGRSLELLEDVIAYLDRNAIRMYRLSSSTIPYGTHPDLPQFDYRRQLDEHEERVAAVGARARAAGLRLSTHPGQYTVLNSPDETIVAKAIADLEQDAALLDALGQGPEGRIVIHVGGVYGDRAAALDRWSASYERLSEAVRARLVVEHDERAWDLGDVLELHRRVGVPVVFDSHHHRCNPWGAVSGLPEALALAVATWPAGVRPKVHVSSPRTELRTVGRGRKARLVAPLLDQHADFASPWDVADVLRAARGPLDVMLEAKAKDLALLWTRAQLARLFPAVAAAEERMLDKSLTEAARGTDRENGSRRKEPAVPEVAKYVTVDAPVDRVYSYWRDFTNFPQFMPHVQKVEPVGGDDTRTHWRVDGPLGKSAEWEAELLEDIPNEKIAWRSVEGSEVKTSGAVRFDERGEKTSIEVALDYDPPGGIAGDAAAKLMDPSKQVDDALARFKEIVESWSS